MDWQYGIEITPEEVSKALVTRLSGRASQIVRDRMRVFEVTVREALAQALGLEAFAIADNEEAKALFIATRKRLEETAKGLAMAEVFK